VSVQDYRINAEVRRYLVSRWVDVQQLHLGATNGVVYVIGVLDTTMEDPTKRLDERRHRNASERILHLVLTLERDIRKLRDVRDVCFKLDNVFKRGGRWRTVDGASASIHQLAELGRATGDQATSRRDGAPHTWKITPEDRSDGQDPETET
jgi:hypothetical protein